LPQGFYFRTASDALLERFETVNEVTANIMEITPITAN
jgi:hypothetical protein